MNYNNKIQFLGFYGGDERVALSAWTSTSRELTDAKRKRIPALLADLWRNKHETPFEKTTVDFLVDSEIASHIHLLKHRISSLNGESARYKELKEDKFYIPEDWPTEWQLKLKDASCITNDLYHRCLEELTPILGRKRAKESARFFKMYNSQIQVDVSFNMRSFANFMKLRNSEHAQLEIREVAQEMWRILENETGGEMVNILKVIDDRIKFEDKCEKYRDLINSLD